MSDQLMAARGAPMNRKQRLALRLSTMPMIAGLLALGAWLLFPVVPLMLIGYGCLVLGVMLSLVVPFVLLRAFVETPNVRNTVLISVLAVGNLPVTFACAVEGAARATRYRVTLVNEAATPWHEVQLVGPGLVERASSIGPNGESVRDVWVQSDGSLELHFVRDDQPDKVLVEGYVTRNLGGAARVIRGPDGQVRVSTE